jgi:hypothetical protein
MRASTTSAGVYVYFPTHFAYALTVHGASATAPSRGAAPTRSERTSLSIEAPLGNADWHASKQRAQSFAPARAVKRTTSLPTHPGFA